MKTIGVIGQGFVGEAVNEGMRSYYKVETYDKFKDSTCESIQNLCEKAKIIFVCVPTPMNSDGVCNTDIVKNVISEVDKYSKGHICVIKSTVPPGTTEKINSSCSDVKTVFNPEFLTEANYLEDFKNQNRIIIGGDLDASEKVKELYERVFPTVPILLASSKESEMVKYFTNCFLATKVSFANQIREICEKSEINYSKVVELALRDDRIGKTHFASPGPDTKYGFGGSCFPKDLNALISVAKNLSVDCCVLESVWNKNLQVRPERDWEQLKGRAVS
tara:strand:- start:334 stop:1161 length:828 start_codon:yes stop_codon:yes gene_type:complete